MYDKSPFSIDNRRFVAFNLAGVNDVPIRIVSQEDPAVAARFFDRFDSAARGRTLSLHPVPAAPQRRCRSEIWD